jgi:hypothetical protein
MPTLARMPGNGGSATGGVMNAFKRTVMFTVVLLACAGVYTALRNMPVLSGCGFYGDCPADATKQTVPAVASRESTGEPVAR